MTVAASSGSFRARRGRRVLLAGVALLALAAGATREIPAARAEGRIPAALADAYETLDAAWTSAPMSFTAGTFVSGEVLGYGRYTPRANATFAPGEPLVVYAEPVGFGYEQAAQGYTIALLADFEIVNPSGQVLASQTGFANLGLTARSRLREFHATLRFAFEGLRPGDYTLVARLRDQASGKTGTLSLPFKVATPRAAN